MTHMNMIRWEPFLRNTVAGRFNQMFDSSSRVPARDGLSTWNPPVDIYDTGTALVLEAELPGLKQDDIDLRVENSILTISGERRRAASENGHAPDFVRVERPIGTFTRTFALPASVDSAKTEARFRDGILTVTLPKTEAAVPRRIDVQVH